MTAHLTRYQVIELPDDKYVFLHGMPGNSLLLQNTKGSLTLTEQQFLILLADGEARFIDPRVGRGGAAS